jgi:hypothetical protein
VRESSPLKFTDLGPLTQEMTESALSVLVGLPLTAFRKPIFVVFEFGDQLLFKNRKGDDITLAEWSFDVIDFWHVTNNDTIVIGRNDMPHRRKGRSRRFFDRRTPPRDPQQRARWQRARDFLDRVNDGRLRVISVSGGPAGAACIQLTDGYAIRAFSADSDRGDLWTLQNRVTKYAFWAGTEGNGPIAWHYEREDIG